MHPSARLGYFFCTIAAIAWAATGPLIAYLIRTYSAPALAVALWRDVYMAAACLLVLVGGAAMGRWQLPRLSRSELRNYALMGAISVGIYHALFTTSVALNGAALAVVLIYLYPTFVTLGARLMFKEPIGPLQALALLTALAGCALLVRIYDPQVLRLSWVGVLVGIGSALTHAGYVLFNQRAMARHSPLLSLTLTLGFGSLCLLILCLLNLGPAGTVSLGVGATPWLVLLGLALGPTLLGYAFFTASLRYIPGSVASLIVVIEAPLATLAAVLLLGERISPPQLLGMVLILIGAVLPGLPLRLGRSAKLSAGATD